MICHLLYKDVGSYVEQEDLDKEKVLTACYVILQSIQSDTIYISK